MFRSGMMQDASMPELPPRLLPVLDGLLRALPAKEIVRETRLSANTVAKYSDEIFKALGVRSRAELVLNYPHPSSLSPQPSAHPHPSSLIPHPSSPV
jgi:DNA-binding NarL/FixJ family response regulator